METCHICDGLGRVRLPLMSKPARMVPRGASPLPDTLEDCWREYPCPECKGKARPLCVLQDWVFDLTLQQQSVLMVALRGPDGIAKDHPIKTVTAHFRATVLKAAYDGKPMQPGEQLPGSDFMSLHCMVGDMQQWAAHVKGWLKSVDDLPHHYWMHLVHGIEIIGYKHPDTFMRGRWRAFYILCCINLHMVPEPGEGLDARLGDWGQRYWDDPNAARWQR